MSMHKLGLHNNNNNNKGPKLESPPGEQLRKVQQAQHNKFVREWILQGRTF